MKYFLLLICTVFLFFISCEKQKPQMHYTGPDTSSVNNVKQPESKLVIVREVEEPESDYFLFNPEHKMPYWQKSSGCFARNAHTNEPDSIDFVGCFIMGTPVGDNVYFLDFRDNIYCEETGKEKYIPLCELVTDPRDTELWEQKMFNVYKTLDEGISICAGTSRNLEQTEKIKKDMYVNNCVHMENPDAINISIILSRYYDKFFGRNTSIEEALETISGS